MKQTNVLQIINTLAVDDGGPARNSLELNLALNRRQDVAAMLLAIHGDRSNSVVEDIDHAAIPIGWPKPEFLILLPRGLPRLFRTLALVREADCVIIHGYFLGWIPLVASTCFVLRVPFLITPHGALTSHQQRSSQLKKKIFEAVAGNLVRRASAGFVTGSRIERDELSRTFPGSKISVGGVGTNLQIDASAAWPAATTTIRLLSMSRIAEKKRIDLSIQACSELVKLGHDARLTVAGDGPMELKQRLIAMVKDLNLGERVSFVGAVTGSQKKEILSASHVFLLPSDDENFGIALAEALASGLPAVTSSAVAAAEGLEFPAGIVLDRPNAVSIAESILKILEATPFEKARAAARQFAIMNYDWDEVATAWHDAINTAGQVPKHGVS